MKTRIQRFRVLSNITSCDVTLFGDFGVGGALKSRKLRRRRFTVPFLRTAVSVTAVMMVSKMRVFHGKARVGDGFMVVVSILKECVCA